MDYAELQNALTPTGGQISISTATLTPNVATLLQSINGSQPIVIGNAIPGPANGQNGTVEYTGTTKIFGGTTPLTVDLRATVDGQANVQLVLTYTLPGDWKFSRSFPDLPEIPNWTQGFDDPTSPPLDGLSLSDARFVLVTEVQKDGPTGVPLQAGANFVGNLTPDGVVGFIETVFGQSNTIVLYGTIVMPTQSGPLTPLTNDQQPWDIPGAIPGITLLASLGLDHTVNKLDITGVSFRAYSPPSSDWLETNPTYVPVLAYTGGLTVPSAGVGGQVVAPVQPGAESLLLLTRFTGVSVANLAAMVDAVGTDQLITQMPPQIASGADKLGDLQLLGLNLELSTSTTDFGLTWAQATIGMPNLDWAVWPGHFNVDSVYTQFEVTDPFNSAREFDVSVYGRIEVERIPVDVIATTKGGFVVAASLAEAQTIPLRTLLSDYAPGISPPSDLTIDAFNVTIAPQRYYSMALAMAEKPNPWVIPLGPSQLTISDVTMNFTYPTTGSVSGAVAGTIAFDDIASLDVSYSVPGPLMLRGSFPELKLSGLLSELTNQPATLPDGFDLEFVDSSALIQAQANNYIFQLATQVTDVGTFAFQVQKVGGQWGFAAGFDLATQPSSVEGLSALSTFESYFGLKQFLLIVSSFDAPTFNFPDLSAFDNPNLPAKKIALPGSNQLVAGLNVYAQWEIDTSDQKQDLLKGLLGLNPTLGVVLQVGENPATNSKLFVSYASTIGGIPLTCQFGGLIQGGEIGLFLTGSMTPTIQGQPQTFTVVLLFVENGAFLSGSMTGPTAIDFGSFKLANLALEIGIDWEGIPSLGIAATIDTDRFEASVAVFFDSANPAKSLVAGSVSSLTLSDVLHTFAGDVVPSEIDDVLSQIALKGTGQFTIPASVGAALDSLDISAVSEAFAQQHVTIPSSSTQVLLTDPDYHPSDSNNVKQPGTRWYLTDLTSDSGSGMRHYELVKQGDTIQVSLSPQFYCAPQATAIGAIQYPQGFFIATALDIFGWHASVTVTIQTSSGIAVDASMDPILIADGTVLSLTGYQGQGGPVLSLATFEQPTQPKPEWVPAHFFASGKLNFLGLTLAEFYVNATEQGLVFDISGTMTPFVTWDVHGHFLGADNFGAGGSIIVGFANESLDLGLSSGPITLNTNAQAMLDVAYDGQTITAKLSFSFTFQGQVLEVAEFDLDVEIGPLNNLWELVKDKIIDRLLHADITLHVDNIVQTHLDQPGSPAINNPGVHTDNPGVAHVDSTTGSHIDDTIKDWQGKPTSHNDVAPAHQDTAGIPHLDQSTPHNDVPGSPHIDSPTQHQDQYYHADQGVETTTKPPGQ